MDYRTITRATATGIISHSSRFFSPLRSFVALVLLLSTDNEGRPHALTRPELQKCPARRSWIRPLRHEWTAQIAVFLFRPSQ